MAHPTYIPGYKFKLSSYAGTDSPGLKTFICGLDNYTLNLSQPSIGAPSRDCSDPTAGVQWQRATGVESWELSANGRYVVAHYAALLSQAKNKTPTVMILERMETVAGVETAQELWTGSFVFENLNMEIAAQGAEFANVSFTANNSGAVTFTPDT